MIRNSPRSRAYPATRIGDCAGWPESVLGLQQPNVTPAARDMCGDNGSVCHHVSLRNQIALIHSRATSVTRPVRHARDDPKLTASGLHDRPGSERLRCVEGRWSLNRRSRVADEPNGDVMRRCPAQCQAVGGGGSAATGWDRDDDQRVLVRGRGRAFGWPDAGRMLAGRSPGRWSRPPGRRQRMQAHGA
jgi:hypothetical protein